MSSMMCGMMLGAGVSATKTYVDDIFSTDLYKSTNQNADYKVTNNLNNSGEGAMLWYKERNGTSWNLLWDTERGSNKYIYSNASSGESTSELLKSFDSDGYTIKGGTTLVGTSRENVLWNFRKAPGSFTIKQYTGTGSNQSISHDLGSIPGMILIKRTSDTEDWLVYHRSTGNNKGLGLNEANSGYTGSIYWNDTTPTASTFSVGTQDRVNTSGQTYIAYIFAGGESTAATARSCSFNGSSSDLQQSSSSDLAFGTGDYTVECWVKPNSLSSTLETLFDSGGNSSNSDTFYFGYSQSQVHVGTWNFYVNQASTTMVDGQWTHIAACRSGSTMRIFKNGTLLKSVTDNTNWASNANITIGRNRTGGQWVNGSISNLRVIKGTALYTSSFRPPTEPLTNVTNTVLLTLNNSSVTGATVSPGTWTNSNVTASTDSPFDDPAGFVFGENEDQNVVKTGSYVGSGTAGLEVNVGFEPQWIIFKNASASYNWYVLDVMRGIVSGGDDAILTANGNDAEWDSSYIDVTSTGFKLQTSHALANGSGNTYIYMCLRRPDGYVGKPPELGTGVFNIDLAGINAGDPSWVSGFPVDMQFIKDRNGTTYNFYLSTRLTQGKYLSTTNNASETTNSVYSHDYQNGWGNYSSSDAELITSWMWKRSKSFTMVTYQGDGVAGREIAHDMNNSVDMMWIKKRDATSDWWVYHSGMTNDSGGGNPEDYANKLNDNVARTTSASAYWNGTAPTSTHFTLGSSNDVNQDGNQYLAMLFSSVDKISKAGYYDGSNSSQTITLGFQPRFLIVRNMGSTGGWYAIDSLRGTGSSGTKLIQLNSQNAQVNFTSSYFTFISTGFTITGTNQNWNAAGNSASNKYLYYAHA